MLPLSRLAQLSRKPNKYFTKANSVAAVSWSLVELIAHVGYYGQSLLEGPELQVTILGLQVCAGPHLCHPMGEEPPCRQTGMHSPCP